MIYITQLYLYDNGNNGPVLNTMNHGHYDKNNSHKKFTSLFCIILVGCPRSKIRKTLPINEEIAALKNVSPQKK